MLINKLIGIFLAYIDMHYYNRGWWVGIHGMEDVEPHEQFGWSQLRPFYYSDTNHNEMSLFCDHHKYLNK